MLSSRGLCKHGERAHQGLSNERSGRQRVTLPASPREHWNDGKIASPSNYIAYAACSLLAVRSRSWKGAQRAADSTGTVSDGALMAIPPVVFRGFSRSTRGSAVIVLFSKPNQGCSRICRITAIIRAEKCGPEARTGSRQNRVFGTQSANLWRYARLVTDPTPPQRLTWHLPLSPQQLEVCVAYANGSTLKQVALDLHITLAAVSHALYKAKTKFRNAGRPVSRREELRALLVEDGIIRA